MSTSEIALAGVGLAAAVLGVMYAASKAAKPTEHHKPRPGKGPAKPGPPKASIPADPVTMRVLTTIAERAEQQAATDHKKAAAAAKAKAAAAAKAKADADRLRDYVNGEGHYAGTRASKLAKCTTVDYYTRYSAELAKEQRDTWGFMCKADAKSARLAAGDHYKFLLDKKKDVDKMLANAKKGKATYLYHSKCDVPTTVTTPYGCKGYVCVGGDKKTHACK